MTRKTIFAEPQGWCSDSERRTSVKESAQKGNGPASRAILFRSLEFRKKKPSFAGPEPRSESCAGAASSLNASRESRSPADRSARRKWLAAWRSIWTELIADVYVQ